MEDREVQDWLHVMETRLYGACQGHVRCLVCSEGQQLFEVEGLETLSKSWKVSTCEMVPDLH